MSAPTARELVEAVDAALANVRRHCGAGAHAWLLVEEDDEAVIVTVRDEGPGIAPGRLEQAVDEGRLGVAQSIRGRIRDVGGTVTITSVPGDGTEVELRVPRAEVPVRPSERSLS
jgi:signal transduction histidine kinase